MIRVQVTERLIFEANELVGEPNGTQCNYWDNVSEEDRLIGAIGESALIDYCWNNDLLAYKRVGRSSDIQLHSGHTIEAKTQKVSSAPQMHYRVNFAARKKDIEKADFMFFSHLQYVAGRPEALWLLGGCSWDKFWRLATFHRVGEAMMRHRPDGNDIPSGRYFVSDCHDLPISQLAPPSASLKHFKSLQQKEEAI